MAETAASLRTDTIAIVSGNTDEIADIAALIDAAAGDGLYEITRVELSSAIQDKVRDTFIALGYKVEYHEGGYTISWRDPQ